MGEESVATIFTIFRDALMKHLIKHSPFMSAYALIKIAYVPKAMSARYMEDEKNTKFYD
jgi:hypothetical protein